MKYKILFIMHMPPPVHGAAMMGKYIHDSKLINETFDCHYVNLALAKDLQDIGKSGLRKFKNFLQLLKTIRAKVKEIRPDVCYVTPNSKGGAFYKDFIVVEMLKKNGCKVIIHFHNKGVSTRQNYFIDNHLYHCFFKNLKVILLADILYHDINKYVNINDIFICPNGIPITNIKKVNKDNNNFEILFLSNMMREKGVWDLIEACKILKERGNKFHCNFVGKWSDINEKTFKSIIKKYELENYITAYGPKYEKEKIPFFDKANLFVFPTFYHNECFPVVLLEAMEYQIPCISTNEGGIQQIIVDGETGYIINKNSPALIAEKISTLINDSQLCKKMGNKGYEKFLSEFTLQKFENRIKDILLTYCRNNHTE